MSATRARSRHLIQIVAAVFSVAVVGCCLSTPAGANPGYELDSGQPSIALGGQFPHGIAIDQVSQNIYVAELTTDFEHVGHGQVEQLNSSGTPTANSPFVTGSGEDFFTGVAVNPVDQSIYAYQTVLNTPFGVKGTSRMNVFSSSGTVGGLFTPQHSTAPHLAADASGRVYFPNDLAGTVQIFSPTGTLESTITCGACPGGGFSKPSAVAIDGAGNLYVAELAGKQRLIKLIPSAGTYAYDSVLQSEEGAVAVGVDPSSDDVFVGDYGEGSYHVVAYDSSGTRYDDFGAEIIGGPPVGIETAGQIAASAVTHKVYVTDAGGNRIWVFNRVGSIPGPLATTGPATSLGQLEATLNATVNPKGHRLTDCHFEYTGEADFQANGFANAISVPCSFKPGGPSSTPVSARVTGLPPGAAYRDRIVTASNGGTASGSPLAFATLPPLAPDATTGTASTISFTGATLGGSVNPNGGEMTDCHFEYTDDADFQENGFANALSKACLHTPEGTVDEPVSAKLTTLAPGTAYSFRLLATNNSGTTEGAAAAFETVAKTCANTPSLCPPPPPPPPSQELQVPPSVTPLPLPTPPKPKPLKCRKGFKKKKLRGKTRCVKVKRHHRSRG